MARLFSTKEIKQMAEAHKELSKKLNGCALLTSSCIKSISDIAKSNAAKNVFAQSAGVGFKSGKEYMPDGIRKMLQFLYIYRNTKPYSEQCRKIKAEYEKKISSSIETAQSKSGISLVFASSSVKEAIDVAASFLNETLNGDYAKAVNEAVSEADRIKQTPVNEIMQDFASNKPSYKADLQDICKELAQVGGGVPEITAMQRKLLLYKNTFAGAEETVRATAEKVKQASSACITASVAGILGEVPIEELNREKNGVRVKTLRDGGFETIADICRANASDLEKIDGISEDSAEFIKEIAHDFAVKTRKTVKLKLSADNKTGSSTRLVSSVYEYKYRSKAVGAYKRVQAQYEKGIKAAEAEISKVGNGAPWLFFDEAQKERIRKAYSYLLSVTGADYGKAAGSANALVKNPFSVAPADAWKDFEENPISYFNTIEEIIPGILGNDDQKYGLPEELASEIQDEPCDDGGLHCDLRRYQIWGVKYILHQKRVLLGDEMGLGKTIQAIASLVSLKNTGATHFIVVCPASVLPNWCKEISTKSDLKAVKIHGSDRDAAFRTWLADGGAAVTTYETTAYLELPEDFRFDMLVVDEAHFVKNTEANRSKNVRKLCAKTDRVLFMTGTALENNVDEMISLVDALQPAVAKKIKGMAFMSAAPQFRAAVSPVYYRRKRESVLTELPDLIETREWCELEGEEESVYEQSIMERNYMNVRRLSWNVDDLEKSSKARRMREIVEEAAADGRKILIFSFFIDTIDKIHDFLGERCLPPINGSLSPQRRQEIIDEFNEAPEGAVLCAQIQSGGTGLNIQAASVVIICEPQFKPSIENQAVSRAYRMGQARNVLVYRLLCENTVDEKLISVLEQKQRIFNAFADESDAVKMTETEIDTGTFADIIDEERERINKKKADSDDTISDKAYFPNGASPSDVTSPQDTASSDFNVSV